MRYARGVLDNALGQQGSRKQPAKHICFDFFGTLVEYSPSIHPSIFNAPHDFATRNGVHLDATHSDKLWADAWASTEQAAIISGRECSMRDIADSYWQLLAQQERGATYPTANDFSRLIREYLTAWTAHITLREGVQEMLTDLGKDHVLSIVSNTHEPTLVPDLCERFAIEHHFVDVFTSVDIGWRKPRAEMFAAVTDALDATPEQIHFVGDNWEADILGPKRQGMQAWYVGEPTKGEEPVSIEELPSLIRAA